MAQPQGLKATQNFFFTYLQITEVGIFIGHAISVEVYNLVGKTAVLNEADIMLIVLGLIDVVMISNLSIMVIVGG